MSMVMPLMDTDTINLTNHIMVQFNMLMAIIMESLQMAKEDHFQGRDLCLIMAQKPIILPHIPMLVDTDRSHTHHFTAVGIMHPFRELIWVASKALVLALGQITIILAVLANSKSYCNIDLVIMCDFSIFMHLFIISK